MIPDQLIGIRAQTVSDEQEIRNKEMTDASESFPKLYVPSNHMKWFFN